MKLFSLILLLCGMSAGAQTQRPLKELNGPEAFRLHNFLRLSGAEVDHQIEGTQITVTQLHCAHGWMQKNVWSYWASCSFVGSDKKNLQTEGAAAEAIFVMLEHAGLKPQANEDEIAIEVSTLRCWLGGQPQGQRCDMEVSEK